MPNQESESKFPLGRTVITRNALNQLPLPETMVALKRHQSGDWGDICEQDRQENERSLIDQTRLFSVYHTPSGVMFWIITEHDRSVTTILLPEDY